MKSNILAKLRKARGFTLIELLIVIAIIAILSVAFLPTLRGGQAKARDAAKISLVNDLSNVIENQIVNAAVLPTNTAPPAGDCITDWSAAPGSSLAGVSYLGRVPQAFPAITTTGTHLCGGNGVWYKRVSDSSYILAIEVENATTANVKAGVTVANIQARTTAAEVITDTNAAVGAGFSDGNPASSKYFYMVGK